MPALLLADEGKHPSVALKYIDNKTYIVILKLEPWRVPLTGYCCWRDGITGIFVPAKDKKQIEKQKMLNI